MRGAPLIPAGEIGFARLDEAGARRNRPGNAQAQRTARELALWKAAMR